jgi:hypothetical protein
MNEDARMRQQHDAQALSAMLRGVGVNALVGIGAGGSLVVYAPNRAQERARERIREIPLPGEEVSR